MQCPCAPGMDGEAIFFTGRRGARPKTYGTGRGTPPLPTVRGGAGKGSKSAGLGGAGAGNILRVLIEIICCSKGNLNLHCIKWSQFTLQHQGWYFGHGGAISYVGWGVHPCWRVSQVWQCFMILTGRLWWARSSWRTFSFCKDGICRAGILYGILQHIGVLYRAFPKYTGMVCDSQSQKNPVSTSAMLTGKCLQSRKVFATSSYWLKNFRIFWKMSGYYTKYPDNVESFRMI